MSEIQVDKKIYEGWIAEDIAAVAEHVPDGLTKKHIIAVLQESINLVYPKYPKPHKPRTNEPNTRESEGGC